MFKTFKLTSFAALFSLVILTSYSDSGTPAQSAAAITEGQNAQFTVTTTGTIQ